MVYYLLFYTILKHLSLMPLVTNRSFLCYRLQLACLCSLIDEWWSGAAVLHDGYRSEYEQRIAKSWKSGFNRD